MKIEEMLLGFADFYNKLLMEYRWKKIEPVLKEYLEDGPVEEVKKRYFEEF